MYVVQLCTYHSQQLEQLDLTIMPPLGPIFPEVPTPYPSCEKLFEKKEGLQDPELHDNLQTFLHVTDPLFPSSSVTNADGKEDSAECLLHESVASEDSKIDGEAGSEDELGSDRGQDTEIGTEESDNWRTEGEGNTKLQEAAPMSPGVESCHSEFQTSSGYITDSSNLMCTSLNNDTSQQLDPFQQPQLLSGDTVASVSSAGGMQSSLLTQSLFSKSTEGHEQFCGAHNMLFDMEYRLELIEKEAELNQQPGEDCLSQGNTLKNPLMAPSPTASPPASLDQVRDGETSAAGSEACSEGYLVLGQSSQR